MGYHIYGIGNALVDKEFEVDDAFFAKAGIEKGMMTLIEEDQLASMLATLQAEYGLKKRACGGSAANTIIGASYFGAKAYYTCNVANDEAGEFYVADMQAAGVDTNMNGPRDEGVTGKCLVMVTPDAERTMNTYLGITSELHQKHIDENALAQSEYVYIEGYLVTSELSREAAIRVRELARQNNVKVAMTFSDPAMVQFFKEGITDMIGTGVDLLFCNEQEAKLFTNTDDIDAAIEGLKKVAKTFAITLGSKGAVAFDGEQLHTIAPHSVTAVDSNGAGDMFAGAFLYAITHGHDFAAAGRLASAASAQVVSQFGPRLNAEQHEPLKQHLA
ncbi:MAG: adenosine kinase [Thalassolituus sp.]|jgi:fructokinase|uniref:Sugar kinase, ribokinase family protein n=2 Tax=root TaxID=1 RepID=M5E938_9GAMM|nr:adenosine kinase [Thalassolituus oleivorans]PHQ83902.1 MAG: adenosine kinase [Thalassobium sp.]AHK16968.1 sugar kinase [Thalassolituus oleivorans R6-15]APR68534.1 adenosine kinase [Thalassolituus oleivorans]MBQ0727453.1 adenosine kinase [Thalassolituus oleivorans]MBQ0779979.1 adenosine kinase [Thalassolituus oleivorans]